MPSPEISDSTAQLQLKGYQYHLVKYELAHVITQLHLEAAYSAAQSHLAAAYYATHVHLEIP